MDTELVPPMYNMRIIYGKIRQGSFPKILFLKLEMCMCVQRLINHCLAKNTSSNCESTTKLTYCKSLHLTQPLISNQKFQYRVFLQL